MHKAAEKLLGILYPARCPGCDALLKRKEIMLCETCRREWKMRAGNVCLYCAKPLHSRFEVRCPECLNSPHEFAEALAPFSYTGAVRESLARFKYHGRAEYAGFYARCIWQYGQRRIEGWNPQVLIPVPVHKSRLHKRGYNQAALIAKELSRITGIPLEETAAVRIRKTAAQKDLGRVQRRENLVNAFAVRRLVPKTVLLVDDIITTGSTADALAELLKKNGAETVYVVSAAAS